MNMIETKANAVAYVLNEFFDRNGAHAKPTIEFVEQEVELLCGKSPRMGQRFFDAFTDMVRKAHPSHQTKSHTDRLRACLAKFKERYHFTRKIKPKPGDRVFGCKKKTPMLTDAELDHIMTAPNL